jgi:hypothetical protein
MSSLSPHLEDNLWIICHAQNLYNTPNNLENTHIYMCHYLLLQLGKIKKKLHVISE